MKDNDFMEVIKITLSFKTIINRLKILYAYKRTFVIHEGWSARIPDKASHLEILSSSAKLRHKNCFKNSGKSFVICSSMQCIYDWSSETLCNETDLGFVNYNCHTSFLLRTLSLANVSSTKYPFLLFLSPSLLQKLSLVAVKEIRQE